jgi:hypothetical protein
LTPPIPEKCKLYAVVKVPSRKKQVAGGGDDNIVDVIFSNVPNNWNENCPLSTIHLGGYPPCMETPRPPKYIMLR